MSQLLLPMEKLYPLIKETLQEGSEVCITVRGNSMSPFLYDSRDQAIFAPLNGRKIRRGDIVFYQRSSGQFVMHRVLSVQPDGMMTMLGDAQWTPEPGIRPEQLRAFVPRVVRNGRTVSCERGLLHRLMTLYLFRIRWPRLTRLLLRLLRAPKALIRKLR